MKILICNTHSILNSGDAGIVLAQIQFLKKYFLNPEIILTSRTPELDRDFYQILGISTFPAIIPAPSVFSKKSQKIWGCLKGIVDFWKKFKLIKEMKNCDLVISSGGGYFYSNRRIFPGPTFFQNYLHLKCATILKKPIIFFPQSFGPFYNPVAGYFLKKILLHKEIITIFAREEISFNLLKKLLKNDHKLEICPDIAFCLSQETHSKETSYHLNLPRPIIALTLRQWLFPDITSKKERIKKKEEYLIALQETCRYIVQSLGGSILILPQVRGPGCVEDDRIISKQLFKDLENVVPEGNKKLLNLSDTVDPLFIIEILSQADLVVATRFHSAIFALIAHIPVISISYQPKSKGIMKLLELDKFCLNISNLETTEITRLIDEILDDYLDIQKKIIKKVDKIRKTIKIKLSSSIQSWDSK